MEFQSIFAWKALPEADFVKKAVIEAHRSKHESIASGWLHGSARPILPQASLVWKVWNLPDCFLRARESVRRASGFVQVGFGEIAIDLLQARLWIASSCDHSGVGTVLLPPVPKGQSRQLDLAMIDPTERSEIVGQETEKNP